MLSQYEPTVKAVIAFCALHKVKVNNSTVNETLQNHPDWPSMLCISDALNKWNVPNGVGKINPEDITQLPTPFIAYTNNREAPLAIVSAIGETTVETYQKNYGKGVTTALPDFLKTWQGVYLIAEPDDHSQEPEYKINKQKLFYNSLMPAASLAVALLLSLYFLYSSLGAVATSAISIYLQYFILLAGVVVTTALLWYEIDKGNPILKKVCTGITKGNCDAILSGKQAKLFSWLSWSEVGFFYFTGSLLVLLFVPNAINIVALLNVLALPYTLFSVYYQWRIAKQWCILCLAVQGLLLLGALNVFTADLLFPITALPVASVAQIILLLLMPVLVWFAVKPMILKLQEAKNTKREYLRIKFNSEIFDTLLKKQKAITVSAEGLGINIGNPNATNTIIKVCNPYCGPCALAHPKIEALLAHNKNVKAKIIFTSANDEAGYSFKPVNHLMAIAAKGNDEETTAALDDWYMAEPKEYDLFAAKYKMNGELQQQGHKIEAMASWCKTNDIKYTPTIFINGQQLPDAYSIEDLQYFLLV